MKRNATVLSDWKQVRALADPLRVRLVEAFAEKPQTTKQVSILLHEKPTRLYHHVDILVEAGLLRLVRTRKNRGTLEKYYQSISSEFTVDRRLLEMKRAPKSANEYESLFLGALEATLAEARHSVQSRRINRAGKERNAWLLCEQISAGGAGLANVVREFRRLQNALKAAPEQRRYRITIAVFPIGRKST